MAARRRVTPSSGNRPLALLRGRMRSLQRAAEAALEQITETPAGRSRSFQERPHQAGQSGDDLARAVWRELGDTEKRGERLLFGLERELTKRLKSVLERLDLPSRRDLEALDERVRSLEKMLTEHSSPKRPTRRKTTRQKPPSR